MNVRDNFPGLGLPEWSLRLVLVLLILGFPVALVLAWGYVREARRCPGGFYPCWGAR